jgi:methanogenic corrinoid protein MtbC1
MKKSVSPRQLGLAIGVSEASVKRWCNKGLLETTRTAGGHRRIPVQNAIAFLKDQNHPLVQPEILGLPPITGAKVTSLERLIPLVRDALIKGDEECLTRLIMDPFIHGFKALDICDRVMAEAFHDLGDRWKCGEIEVFEERRGCEIARKVLFQLFDALPPPKADAPLAIGGTLTGDHYEIPMAMISITLRELGLQTMALGTDLSGKTLGKAIKKLQPDLFWLSISHIENRKSLIEDYNKLFQVAESNNVPIALGGRALTDKLHHQLHHTVFCENLEHLANFVRTTILRSRK